MGLLLVSMADFSGRMNDIESIVAAKKPSPGLESFRFASAPRRFSGAVAPNTMTRMRLPSSRSPIVLPSPLQRRLETRIEDFFRAGAGPDMDFSSPPGEAALSAPDSVSWRIFKNPLSLFIGGVTAVILELAEPRVREGVWRHTRFRDDALQRMQRTGLAAMMTVYGPRSRTEAMIERVCRMHACISGTTPDGRPYRADDPELLSWVHATASFGFLKAYHVYVHSLDHAERNRFYEESATSSRIYGALDAPTSEQELHRLFLSMRDTLEASPVVFEFLEIVRKVALLPRPLAFVQDWLVRAAVELVPLAIRERLALAGEPKLQAWQHAFIRRCGEAIDRIPLKTSPAVQACRRIGLPEDYLYTRW